MMRLPRKKFAFLACVLVAINVVGLVWIHHNLTKVPGQAVRVISAMLSPSIPDADCFTLTFDRHMVLPKAVGRAEEAAVFKIEPAWPGKWIWAARDKIEYMLYKPLPPGRVFSISSTAELKRRTGKVLDGKTEFRFETGSLELISCGMIAADQVHLTLELTFNQPVNPPDLLRHISFYDGKSSAKLGHVQCLTKGPAEKMAVRTSRPSSNRLRIVLDERLVGHGAELPLGKKVTRNYRISPGFSLLGQHVETPRLNEIISVRLRFSHTLSREQEPPKLAIVPAVEEVKTHRSGNDLVVSGRFKTGVPYDIKIPGTLLADNGQTLGEEQTVQVNIPARKPGVGIPNRRGILSPLGNMTLEMKVANVAGLKLTAWRVHENNLVPHLWGVSRYATSRSLGEKIVKLDVRPDQLQKLAVNLRDFLKDPPGIYRIRAQAVGRRWTADYALIAVTDLAITAKLERTGSLVWITSLRTGKPVAGATVRALTYTNQLLATGRTDERGIVRLAFPLRGPDGPVWVITAEKNGNLSYLKPNDSRWVIDDVDQAGRSYAKTYEVMLYTERGVYRPGDIIRLTGIIRDGQGQIPPAFPLAVTVTRPDGRQVAELMGQPQENGQGFFHVEFPTRSTDRTGPYRFAAALPGSKDVLGWTHAQVEAFMPVRMEVKAQPTAARFGPQDTPRIKVSARYLWDQPAAKLPISVECALNPAAFKSKKHPDFQFTAPKGNKRISLPTSTGRLDESGKAELEIKLPDALKPGVYGMRLSATVTELGGRSVSSNTTAVLDSLDRHIGLRLSAGQVVSIGQPVAVDWVRLTGADEQAAPGEMTARLDCVEYDTALREVNNRRVWRSVEKTTKVKSHQIKASAGWRGSFEVTCADAGMYRLTVTDKKTGSRSRLEFYASQDQAGAQSLAMNRPERLEIIPDRKKYLPGETAKVLVRSPLPGTLLLTVETDRVLASHIAQITDNTAEVEVPLPRELRGGAFITATVVRQVDPKRKSWLPHRAMGMARVLIDHDSKRLPVTFIASKKAEPGKGLSVTVKTAPPTDPQRPTFVHLWAVDEGILLAAAYRTPDLHGFFLGPRRAWVATADLFSRLMPDYDMPAQMTRIGADGGPELDDLRRSPVPTRLREAAVVWRKVVPVDSNGQVTVEMKLPELVGEMRLMAVAVDHDRYGQGEQAVTLTSPLIVETTWPRFAAPGDAFEVPVKLFNSTDSSLAVRVKTAITGPVEISPDPALERIVVNPGQPATRFLKVRATALGPVDVRVEAEELQAGDDALSAYSKASFPVRPATALHTEVKLLSIPAGDKLVIDPPDSFIEGTARMTIDISPRPSVQLGPALEEMIDYPYGCVEQTTSQLFSLLYAPRILTSARAKQIEPMVQAGIARLWSMQTRSGGLSYWPGGAKASMWGTAYASSCLLEARNAGYKIDPRFMKELLEYLQSRLKTTDEDAPDINTQALICRVLSMFDHPPHGWMARLAERKKQLDLAGLAHLAGAFWAAGRKDRALAILPKQPPAKAVATTTAGRLTSQVRQEAIWLSVLLDIAPADAIVPRLAGRLDKARRNGRWASTLENAGAIAALTRYQAMTAKDKPEFTGTIEAAQGRPIPFDHTKPVSHKFAKVAAPIIVSSAGSGTIYVAVSSEGLAKEGVVRPYSRQLSLERRWSDRDGKPVDPAKLRVGDLVRVQITIRSPLARVNNIAVVDALPGGMEVENPRLATSAAGGGQTGHTPDHVEFLDDRVVLFCTAGPAKRIFRYALRATTAGRFHLPPIQASCMYDPAVASLGEPARAIIRR